MPVKIPRSRLITLIATLLMGASSFLLVGMTLEDTQGRTLEARDVQLEGKSVSFTRVDTGRKFNVPLATFSESTQEAISKIASQENLREVLPVPGNTEGYKPTDQVRVLDITPEKIVYEIPERLETRKGDPFKFITQSQLSNIFDEFVHAIMHKNWRQLEGHWLSLKNGSKIRITGRGEYEMSVNSQGPFSIDRKDAAPQWEPHIQAYELRAEELKKSLKSVKHLEIKTPSDKNFNQWMLDWYIENLFRHPEIPMAFVNRLLHDPELRLEYIDAFTFPEELENRKGAIMGLGAFHSPAEGDKPEESRRILSEISRDFPEELQGNTRLALALSLIYDAGASYSTTTFSILKYMMPQKGWLRDHLEVFQWKTDPSNIENFVFKNEDLTVRQQTWANGTSQSPENLEWANKEPFNPDLNQMYRITEYGKGTWGRHHDIKTLDRVKAVCAGQAHVLRERLIARNVPNTYSAGGFNNHIELPHAYTLGLTPEGVKSGGAWERSNGATMEPTNNAQITDAMFYVQISEEYNSPIRQKLRVKTQYAATLSPKEQKSVIKDILSENRQFAPAYILMLQDKIPEVGFENLLDQALFHQALVWKHAAEDNVEGAIKALHQMVEGEPEPIIRLGWTAQTWFNIQDIEIKLALAPEFGKIAPTYPRTIGIIVMRPLKYQMKDNDMNLDAFQKAKRELIKNARDEYRDFKEILEHRL